MNTAMQHAANALKSACADAINHEGATVSTEAYFDAIVSTFTNFSNQFKEARDEISAVTEIGPPRILKEKLKTLPNYFILGDRPITKMDYFAGDLNKFAFDYLTPTKNMAESYSVMLESYVTSLLETSNSMNSKSHHYRDTLKGFLANEKKFSTKIVKYFKGNVNDVSLLIEQVPNEKALMEFAEQMWIHRGHVLTNVKYYNETENLIDAAAIALANVNKNVQNKKLDDSLVKALARDGYSIAEIAGSMVGRGHTIQQMQKVYQEVLGHVDTLTTIA